MVAALRRALNECLQADPKVLVMGEDIGLLGGVFRVTDGLLAQFGPRRVMDTPIAESGIVGTAIGLALRGYRPVVEIQFDGFVYPAFDQIVSQLARFHSRSGGRMAMPVTVRIPYGGGIGAIEHHSESPEALFAHVPGLRVVSPAIPGDAYRMLKAAIVCPDPVIFLEPKVRYWDTGEVAPAGAGRTAAAELGQARTVRQGNLVTVVTYGPALAPSLEAAKRCAARGLDVEVIDLRSLSPLDLDWVVASVERTGRCVVVHEAPVVGGIGGEVAAAVTESCFYRLEAPVVRVGGYYLPYPPARLERDYLPTADRIGSAIADVLGY
jgi:pyruvate dehydrogenase E1 component beta subunit